MTARAVRHLVVDYDKTRYAGHPRQCGIANFGGGEIAVLYRRAPCAYETEQDVSHRPSSGYMSRSDIVLRRSTDHGETWPPENDVVLFSNGLPVEERIAWLSQNPDERPTLEMDSPDSMIFTGFTSLLVPGPEAGRLVRAHPTLTGTYQIRSADRGRTWEKIPLPLESWGYPPVVRLPDGRHARNHGSGQVSLSLSDDGGQSWQRQGLILRDPSGLGSVSYSGLLPLPDGRLQCYHLQNRTDSHALSLTESIDLETWTPPRPIVRFGRGSWAARAWNADTGRLRTEYGGWEQRHRSPWPLRLRDGRIVVFFARREYPPSIACLVSEDDGRAWSDEIVLRDDAEGSDMGYPVATELDDGRLLVAYYFQKNDGNAFGGTCFFGATVFELG